MVKDRLVGHIYNAVADSEDLGSLPLSRGAKGKRDCHEPRTYHDLVGFEILDGRNRVSAFRESQTFRAEFEN